MSQQWMGIWMGLVCAAAAFGEVRFEENLGQVDGRVQYVARARGQQVFFTGEGEIVLAGGKGERGAIRFAGTSGGAQWRGDGDLVDTVTYLVGNDPSKWVHRARAYQRIVWRGVYPGIDAVFYGASDGRLEYDLVLAPGADASQVRLQVEGPTARLLEDGSIVAGPLRQRAPQIHQLGRVVEGGFVASGENEFRLELGAYERSQPVVVDPVIEWATYSGGDGDDEIVAVGTSWVAGNTRSLRFPGTSAAVRRSRDIFFRTTDRLLLSGGSGFAGTLIVGGSGDDELVGAGVVETSRSLLLAGSTTSWDLPGVLTARQGGASDGFLMRVPVGQALPVQFLLPNISTQLIGGSGEDRILGFSLQDSTWIATGVTDSADLPVRGSSQPYRGGKDAFYALSPFGGTAWIGYLGGAEEDAGMAAAVVRNISGIERAYFGGTTRSGDFPFSAGGLSGPSDGFVAELSPISLTIAPTVTVHRIGGDGEDAVRALSYTPFDLFSRATPFVRPTVGVAGTTTSSNLSTGEVEASRPGGDMDAFVGSWDVGDRRLAWASYVGGSGHEEALAISRSSSGDLVAGGWTRSVDLPLVNPLQSGPGGGEDGWFAVFDGSGQRGHVSYYGGSGDDRIQAITMRSSLWPRLAGATTSRNLPQFGPSMGRGESGEGFVADIGVEILMGPSELVLANDGAIPLRLVPGRTMQGVVVHYAVSDPSKVQLTYRERSGAELVVQAGEIQVEGLADRGEVEITASAGGFVTKRIKVRLYPGAFRPPATVTTTTMEQQVTIFAGYYPIDPQTNEPVGDAQRLRSGIEPPKLTWTMSDPAVAEGVTTVWGREPVVQVRGGGTAEATLAVEGFRVVGPPTTLTVEKPVLRIPEGRRIGVGLLSSLGVTFATSTRPGIVQGLLTVRSEDPSRLLVAGSETARPSRQATVSLDRPVALMAYAVPGSESGPVRLVFTSTEFAGEVPMTVTLEPAVLRLRRSRTSAEVLVAKGRSTSLTPFIESESGVPGGRSLGSPAWVIQVRNRNPEVVELSRLTLVMNDATFGGTPVVNLLGRAAGEAELSVSTNLEWLSVPEPRVQVTVSDDPALVGSQGSVVTEVLLGKDLAATVNVNVIESTQVTVTSEDPSAVLLALPDGGAPGAPEVTVPRSGASIRFVAYGLKDTGDVTLRIVPVNETSEQRVRVKLVGSGPGFVDALQLPQGIVQLRIGSWAIEQESGVGLVQQPPRPGVSIGGRLRADGEGLQFSREQVRVTAAEPVVGVEASGGATAPGRALYVEPIPGEGTVASRNVGKRVISPLPDAAPPALEQAVLPQVLMLQRDESRAVLVLGGALNSTITSSDPSRLLVSSSPFEPGAASASGPSAQKFLHAVGDSGSVIVRAEAAGFAAVEIRVYLQPAILRGGVGRVRVGETVAGSLQTADSPRRPGAPRILVSLQSSDPSIFTVTPSTMEVSASAAQGSFRVTGLRVGSGRLEVIAPEGVELESGPIWVTVEPAAGPARVTPGVTPIGKNLQRQVQLPYRAGEAGAILTVTSSDPSRLLLSRTASALGSDSVVVAVPPGTDRTQPFYVQALGSEGDVQLRLSGGELLQTVRLSPSWIGCTGAAITLRVNPVTYMTCRYEFRGRAVDLSPELIPGIERPVLRVSSSDPEIVTVSPEEVQMGQYSASFTVRGLAVGTAMLRLSTPEGIGFGPPEEGGESVSVVVRGGALQATVPGEQTVLAPGGMATVSVTVPVGVRVTATSVDSGVLLLGSGESSVVIDGTGRAVEIPVRAVGVGTGEVLLQAAGYLDRRFVFHVRR